MLSDKTDAGDGGDFSRPIRNLQRFSRRLSSSLQLTWNLDRGHGPSFTDGKPKKGSRVESHVVETSQQKNFKLQHGEEGRCSVRNPLTDTFPTQIDTTVVSFLELVDSRESSFSPAPEAR